MSDLITTSLTRNEFILIWNCVHGEIANRVMECGNYSQNFM